MAAFSSGAPPLRSSLVQRAKPKSSGVMAHRYTAKRHEPRGVFCAIGRCTDCVMVVDGKPNVRTCITPLKEGMVVETQYGASAKEEA